MTEIKAAPPFIKLEQFRERDAFAAARDNGLFRHLAQLCRDFVENLAAGRAE